MSSPLEARVKVEVRNSFQLITKLALSNDDYVFFAIYFYSRFL